MFFAEAAEPPSSSDLPFCTRIIAVPKPPMYTPGKILRGLAGPWPLPIVNYTSTEMTAALAGICRDCVFDLVHLDSIHMAAYVPVLKGPCVYNWHNIESEAMQRYGENIESRPKKYTLA